MTQNVSKYGKVLVNRNTSLIDAIKLMNENAMQVLIVVDADYLLEGIVTDGDIRGAIVNNMDFSISVDKIMNTTPITVTHPVDRKKVCALMKSHSIKHIPIVDENRKFLELVRLSDLIENEDVSIQKRHNKVVIMAGGKGTRLDIFTRILPKPLIPIGDKPIVEHIMDNFVKYGFENFLLCLNYKADMIKMYFSDNNKYCPEFIREEKFLGTAGALALCKGKFEDTFIVSNCDVIIDTDVDELFTFHRLNKNHATILGTIQHIRVPYGVLKTQNGDFEDIIEKPEYSFLVNSGVYVLEPDIIDLIQCEETIDMPDLLLRASRRGYSVQVYPMTCSWFDVGQWNEYRRALEHMNVIGRLD